MNSFKYLKENWVILAIGGMFLGGFVWLTYGGNQFCDCEKTETYRDGTTRNHHSSGVGYYRYYHK